MPSLTDHHAILIQRLAGLQVPQIYGAADGNDIRALAAHLTEVADAVDAYVMAVGRLAKSECPCLIDLDYFGGQLFAALQGNATFELNAAADDMDAERNAA